MQKCFLFLQKMFHEDVVQVVRKRLELEEDLPEAQRPTALARSYYLKVLFDILEKKTKTKVALLFYDYEAFSENVRLIFFSTHRQMMWIFFLAP